MTTLTKTLPCACGGSVVVSMSENAPPWLRDQWERLTEGICAACEQAEAERAARERDELRARRVAARLERSDLPLALRGLQWEQLERQGRARAVGNAQRWARGELRGLLLHGPVGVGKTRIAATAANAMLEHRRARWTSMPTLFARLGAGANETSRRAALELLTGDEALVLDDLDKARPTTYGAEQVLAAIDNRITAGAPLLVTTNLSPNELAEKFPDPFGEAIASRLAGYCQVHELGGHDRRLQPVAA